MLQVVDLPGATRVWDVFFYLESFTRLHDRKLNIIKLSKCRMLEEALCSSYLLQPFFALGSFMNRGASTTVLIIYRILITATPKQGRKLDGIV